ncbi:hypothetical protein CEXT_381361 [Caerostris extrusa]|uniref:Uncharacterized protein n=1 Tax=Caerostris extrusa TaxID=172846 RepID=A0AAV4TE09_CAEEX|nr:hypothetical protein CEXT_381361 [Caerostris extrusa]
MEHIDPGITPLSAHALRKRGLAVLNLRDAVNGREFDFVGRPFFDRDTGMEKVLAFLLEASSDFEECLCNVMIFQEPGIIPLSAHALRKDVWLSLTSRDAVNGREFDFVGRPFFDRDTGMEKGRR